MHYGIIAAGAGSRLVQEGVALPKPLVRINNRPMIGRLLEIFIQQGAESVAIIINEQMTDVRKFIEEFQTSSPVPIDLVVKTTPSSMHSFYELANILEKRGRFILTTVDTIFRQSDFAKYVEAFSEAPEGIDGIMAITSHIDDEKPLYVATDEYMRITAFLDSPTHDSHYVSGGIYGLDTSSFSVLRQCIEQGMNRMRNFQRALLDAGLHIYGFDMGKIIDVDHAEDIRKAEDFINQE